jgi:predicted N-formylglutamate amidohydrolase
LAGSPYLSSEPSQEHWRWDPGTAELFYSLAPLAVFSQQAQVSRLVVDLNRSLDSLSLSRLPPGDLRELALEEYYAPFRNTVLDKVAGMIHRGQRVLHLSLHSFTPNWKGKERAVDIGLLYSAQHSGECSLALSWQRSLRRAFSPLKVFRNRPYWGSTDGHCTALRRHFDPRYYWGIELEVKNSLLIQEGFRYKLLSQLKALVPGSFP